VLAKYLYCQLLPERNAKWLNNGSKRVMAPERNQLRIGYDWNRIIQLDTGLEFWFRWTICLFFVFPDFKIYPPPISDFTGTQVVFVHIHIPCEQPYFDSQRFQILIFHHFFYPIQIAWISCIAVQSHCTLISEHLYCKTWLHPGLVRGDRFWPMRVPQI
jgi:hypothetical protein